jgi:hypothetical protein
MTNWIETYRGAVPPWQCDVTEHFTVAYYFDRLEEAEANLADQLGVGRLPHRGDQSRRINARFARELRRRPAPAFMSRAQHSVPITGCVSAIALSIQRTARS